MTLAPGLPPFLRTKLDSLWAALCIMGAVHFIFRG
jgi:uncharacterized protein (DUF486 family)